MAQNRYVWWILGLIVDLVHPCGSYRCRLRSYFIGSIDIALQLSQVTYPQIDRSSISEINLTLNQIIRMKPWSHGATRFYVKLRWRVWSEVWTWSSNVTCAAQYIDGCKRLQKMIVLFFLQNHPQNSFPLAKSWVCHLCKYIPSNCIFDSSPHSPQFQMHASVQIGAFFVVMFRLVVLTFDILWPWNWEVYRCTLRLRSFFLRSTFPGNSFQSWRKGSGNKQTWSNEGIVSDGFMLVSDSLSG